MITLENVLDWLKTLNTKADHYYAGTLPDKKPRSFGVYQLKDSRMRDIAVGGAETTLTQVKAVSLLIHWEQSTRSTENAALALWNEIAGLTGAVIGGHRCSYIMLLNSEPVDVGTDGGGICECVIEFLIYYNKEV